jgi:copper chaperone CopZ
VVLKVDMMCEGCVGAVKRVLSKLDGATRAASATSPQGQSQKPQPHYSQEVVAMSDGL